MFFRSLLSLIVLSGVVAAAQPHGIKDIEFAVVDGHSLQLDLYLPAETQKPLIVWVHGGGWRAGTRAEAPIRKLVNDGYAVASVDYRLSPVAPFPAQIHDIKAAIRFLRAKAPEYGYDAKRIVISGSSAGGHLAALVGVSNGVAELEGKVGTATDQSSDVQAIISLFGASNLQTILSQSTEAGKNFRGPALQLLLGGSPEEKPALAKLASPVAHVDRRDPPLLLIHGDADPQMPPAQSVELEAAYRKAGAPVQLVMIQGAVHGGPQFFDGERLTLMRRFLAESLK